MSITASRPYCYTTGGQFKRFKLMTKPNLQKYGKQVLVPAFGWHADMYILKTFSLDKFLIGMLIMHAHSFMCSESNKN